MVDRTFNVLFLCTGNSARSIIAEAILNELGGGLFRAWSAGSRPKGRVHPETLRLLKRMGHNIFGFRSKSWAEFIGPGGPVFDFVFTVCDNAAMEVCPAWPGQPIMAHWGVPDHNRAENERASGKGFPRCLLYARPPNQFVPVPASCSSDLCFRKPEDGLKNV